MARANYHKCKQILLHFYLNKHIDPKAQIKEKLLFGMKKSSLKLCFINFASKFLAFSHSTWEALFSLTNRTISTESDDILLNCCQGRPA